MIERGSNEGKDFVPEEECPLLLTDSNFRRVTVSTDASQSSRDSKLRPRRSVKPHEDVLETPSEAEMPVGDALLKRQEETEDGKIGTSAVDDDLSPFPDSMSLMEIVNQIRTAKVGKARKKKRTENQETLSDGECVALAIGGESAPSTPWPADFNSSGISYPFMEEIIPNLHSTRESNYLDVLREFDDYVMCSEMCDELQNADFLSHQSTLVNFSKPCIVGNDNGGLAKGTKVEFEMKITVFPASFEKHIVFSLMIRNGRGERRKIFVASSSATTMLMISTSGHKFLKLGILVPDPCSTTRKLNECTWFAN